MARAFKLGDNINTDEIIPGRYNVKFDPEHLKQYCFCELRPDFPASVQVGDTVVGGENFGCGSSREHAPIALKATGISCVIAKSYARIFYRNAINIGLPILECSAAVDGISEGDEVVVVATGRIENVTTGDVYQAQPLPAFVLGIVEAGGVIEYIKKFGELKV